MYTKSIRRSQNNGWCTQNEYYIFVFATGYFFHSHFSCKMLTNIFRFFGHFPEFYMYAKNIGLHKVHKVISKRTDALHSIFGIEAFTIHITVLWRVYTNNILYSYSPQSTEVDMTDSIRTSGNHLYCPISSTFYGLTCRAAHGGCTKEYGCTHGSMYTKSIRRSWNNRRCTHNEYISEFFEFWAVWMMLTNICLNCYIFTHPVRVVFALNVCCS